MVCENNYGKYRSQDDLVQITTQLTEVKQKLDQQSLEIKQLSEKVDLLIKNNQSVTYDPNLLDKVGERLSELMEGIEFDSNIRKNIEQVILNEIEG